ncbi:myelin-associated glycoprotein-like isoform X1 [Hemiscyllium ocellatum]|uniref:myelin-associated glycoprotein-like isoform X1 n=1 Tax=Hemiscyllium ocellatum TaxID=170820 RepID=UPI00296729E6|nr:myelin-associated glycoprotein-like isoform X1 [Hemiscyllium ocellatum]
MWGQTMIGKSCLLLLLLQAGLMLEWDIDTPRNVTAQKGSCARIPCRYTYPSKLVNQTRVGIWFNANKQGTSLIAFHSRHHSKELPRFRHRTRLSGDLNDGDCSLIVNNIRQEDAGPYFFRVEFQEMDKFNYLPETQLYVSNFTDKPTIFPVEIIAGKCVSLNCIFNTTCNGTAPALTWDTPIAADGSLSNTVTQHGVTLSYTSVLSLTPSLRHQGQTLTCRVSYPTVSSEQTLILTVQYGPVFSRELECARRAEGITCICAANSNPPGDLTWHLPHANLSGNQTHGDFVSQQLRVGHLVMGSLTLTGHSEEEETMASCSVRNPHGAAMLKAYFWVKERDFNKWTAGLVMAGIMLSVFLAGILTFLCCQKRKTVTEETASKVSDIAVTYPPDAVTHQVSHNMVVTDLQNTTRDPARGGETPAPGNVFEGPVGRDTAHPGSTKDLLYASINYTKLPSSDGAVQRGEDTEYAQIRFQPN